MKKILAGLLFLFVANFSYASHHAYGDKTYLTVVNNWTQTVRVSEGWLLKKQEEVPSGRSINWLMIDGAVSDLSIAYLNNGLWQQIPGCPYGSYSYGLKVFIKAAPWDPKTPICQQV